MTPMTPDATLDLKDWLRVRNVDPEWAVKLADMLKLHYPSLVTAVKAHKDVIGELELVKLVSDVLDGRFPPHFSTGANRPKSS